MIRKLTLTLTILALLVSAAAAAFVAWANKLVMVAGEGRVFTQLADMPEREIALVLGTSKYSRGRINSFYAGRVRAAAELYHRGKVAGILVSGDNGSQDYNEPAQMKADLVALGVPAEHITADYAGFRTLDSVYRAGDVFGLDSYVIVTQAFHLPRALYLADQKGHDVIGYAASGPSGYWSRRVQAREVLARVQAVVDVEVLRRGPRFLGDPVQVSRRPSADAPRHPVMP